MLVSIITICFNSEAAIRKTIESVLAQTYDNIEYLIIDGASKDNTILINSYVFLWNNNTLSNKKR